MLGENRLGVSMTFGVSFGLGFSFPKEGLE
jgi:hypothetical protein